MYQLLVQMSALKLFIILTSITITLSMIAVFMIRKIIIIKPEYKDDPILGSIATLIGTIYGVLAGLTALFLVNNINYTADAVQREANSIADIYRYSKWLKEPQRSLIQADIHAYINNVINVEWPSMKSGHPLDSAGDETIEKITSELITYKPTSTSESLLTHDMLDQLRLLYDARQQRIHMSNAKLNPEIWFVILVGTILTMGINFLFRMKIYLHIIAICATGLMLSSMVFLLLSLDRPFQGEFVIEPEAFYGIIGKIHKTK